MNVIPHKSIAVIPLESSLVLLIYYASTGVGEPIAVSLSLYLGFGLIHSSHLQNVKMFTNSAVPVTH